MICGVPENEWDPQTRTSIVLSYHARPYNYRVKQSPSGATLTSELKVLSSAITVINIKLEVLQAEVLNVWK